MEVKKVPQVILNSGRKMPVIGLGTASMSLPIDESLTSIFIDAFEVGYRHFDTAALYGSEEPLGNAIAKALKLGIAKSREEVFITSKLLANNCHHDLVLPALHNTLQKLGLEYVDLYLIHWPVRLKPEAKGVINITKEDLIPFDIKGTWKTMEECQKLGLAKSIGVGNFGIKKLNQLLENATIPPAVNQVEMSPSWQQKKLRELCMQKGIHIALRWIYEQGASAIVKSFNKERMKQNLEIFDWELSQEELRKFSQIPQLRMFSGEMFVSEKGPYKSVEELWDDDPLSVRLEGAFEDSMG